MMKKQLLIDAAGVLVHPRATFESVGLRLPNSSYVFPLVVLDGVAFGAFLASFAPRLILNQMMDVIPSQQSNLSADTARIIQLGLMPLAVGAALFSWVFLGALMYIAGRLAGGERGIHRSMVPVGFSLLPLSLYYSVLFIISVYNPSFITSQTGAVTPIHLARLAIIVWSSVLLGLGATNTFRIRPEVALASASIVNLIIYVLLNPGMY